MAATSEFIGRVRACAVAETQRTYRWIYRTVLRDWDALAELYERHGLIPIRTAPELIAENAKAAKRALNGGAEKVPQQRGRPHLLDPAVKLRRVVAGRLAEDAGPCSAPALGIPRPSRAGGCEQTRWPPRTSGRARA